MYKCILVDDEDEIRQAIAAKVDFNSAGFELCGTAANGADALELIEKTMPDLVITDIKMPYMTGIELARAIREIHPYASIVFLTGYDDFSYAQQAIHYNILKYILKPILPSEFVEALCDVKRKMDERTYDLMNAALTCENVLARRLTDIVPMIFDSEYADFTEQSQIIKRLVEDELLYSETDNSKFAVMVTKFVFNMCSDEELKKTRTLAVNMVDKILKKYLRSFTFESSLSGGGCFVFRTHSLIVGNDHDLNKYLKIAVKEIEEACTTLLKQKVFFGLSSYADKPPFYNLAVEASAALSYSSENRARFIGDYEAGANEFFHAVVASGSRMEQLLKSGTSEEIKDLINGISAKTVNKNDFGIITTQALSAVFAACEAVTDAPPPTDIVNYIIADSYVRQTSVSELKENILNMLIKTREYIADKLKANSDTLANTVLSQIETRYGESDFGLAKMCNEQHYSAPYVSTLIKRVTGSSFVDLLTKKRMEKAEELIKNSNMKVAEIAEHCGYLEQHYFSFCFKKFFGVSPIKMREATQIG